MKQISLVHVANIDVGLNVHLGNYMRYQRSQGYNVSAICPPGEWIGHDTTILDGIFVKTIAFEPRLSPLSDLRTLVQLVRYFRAKRFDIVHTHTVKPGLLGRLAAKIAGVPIIVHTVHGFHFYADTPALQYRIFVLIEKLGAACCDSILSQNTADIDTAIRERICSPDKVHHLGNGIDLSRFDPQETSLEKAEAARSALGIPPQAPVVGFVGRLIRDKGIYEFLEAASLLKSSGVNAKYVVVGVPSAGETTDTVFGDLLRGLGIETEVIFTGYREDVAELVSMMDIIALPSYGREGIPRVLMESAALGKPAVATRVRGNTEAVDDGRTGLLVPVRDAKALADGIGLLLSSPERAAAMGRQARERALTHFDERLFFWKTDVEYRRLLGERLSLDASQLLSPVPSVRVQQ